MILSNLDKYFPRPKEKGFWQDGKWVPSDEELDLYCLKSNFIEWLMIVFAFANTRDIKIKTISNLMVNGDLLPLSLKSWTNHYQFVTILQQMCLEEYIEPHEFENKFDKNRKDFQFEE